MKNHFFVSYVGNKRDEIDKFYKKINFDDIDTIIEPFCGSCAMSFYISQKQPNKFKYIFNDLDDFIYKLLSFMKDSRDDEIKAFEDKINNYIDSLNSFSDDFLRKEMYNKIVKNGTFEGVFFGKKYFKIRAGLYPTLSRVKKINKYSVKCPMFDFLRSENVVLSNNNGLEIYKENVIYSNCLMLIDPPYMLACNDFYISGNRLNIYEYCANNDISQNKAKTYFILENIWIIKLLFGKYYLDEYEKEYNMKNKKKTSHVLIYSGAKNE
jgi:site-specific DNA-adenine methylase